MEAEDEYFVSTCSHVNETDEIDASGRRRLAWLRSMFEKGLRIKVARLNGKPVGFLYAMPIEVSPWDFIGESLLAIPCLWVIRDEVGKGVGRALIDAAEREAKEQGLKGMVTTAFYHDFWFMPAGYFETLGFEVADRRKSAAVLWKHWDPSAKPPKLMERNYEFKPIPGNVVIDLFWNPICLTTDIEAQRVREIAAEFGDGVVLNEYPADDREVLLKYRTPRAILVNGNEIYWGYEAPREGIREAIAKARDDSSP
jgi:GNAT superfamily N-acetyltransferase